MGWVYICMWCVWKILGMGSEIGPAGMKILEREVGAGKGW